MATLVETRVEVTMSVLREGAGIKVGARVRSFTSDGMEVRDQGFDVTPFLTAAEITGATNLLTKVENAAKTRWDIA